MKLLLETPALYRVKRGQTLSDIARVFRIPPRLLAAYNHLSSPPEEGSVLEIPSVNGNLYLVRGGESMTLLCGSRENFIKKNMTKYLYPGQLVIL